MFYGIRIDGLIAMSIIEDMSELSEVLGLKAVESCVSIGKV